MIWTHIARVVAVLMFGFGILVVLLGYFPLEGIQPPWEIVGMTRDEWIGQGYFNILLAVVVGVLVNISDSLHKPKKKDDLPPPS